MITALILILKYRFCLIFFFRSDVQVIYIDLSIEISENSMKIKKSMQGLLTNFDKQNRIWNRNITQSEIIGRSHDLALRERKYDRARKFSRNSLEVPWQLSCRKCQLFRCAVGLFLPFACPGSFVLFLLSTNGYML